MDGDQAPQHPIDLRGHRVCNSPFENIANTQGEPRKEILIDYLAADPVIIRNTLANTRSESESSGEKSPEDDQVLLPKVEVLSLIERLSSDVIGVSIEVNQIQHGVETATGIANIAIQVKTPATTPQGSLNELIKELPSPKGSSKNLKGLKTEVCNDPQGITTTHSEVEIARTGSPVKKSKNWFCCTRKTRSTSPTYIPNDILNYNG